MMRRMPAPPETRKHDFPSGAWTGYHQQAGRKIAQDLELTFADGVVRGAGWDTVGEFVVKGSYDEASGEVRWTKKYTDGHAVACRGFREGRGIWGTWRMRGAKGSGFHIWPVGSDAR
jgi:hypothetical protein